MTLTLTVLQSLPEMQALSTEWNALLQESASNVPFLRNEYLCAWWAGRGGGEWPTSAELFVITARDVGGNLAGIAPLFRASDENGRPVLHLLGQREISDFLDLIARPADLPLFVSALVDFLTRPQAPAWHALDLCNFLDSSPTLPLLRAAAQDCGLVYTQTVLEPAPCIPLPGDWEAYLAGIDKKQRHEIRRKMRRLEEAPVQSELYITSSPEALPQDIDDFMALMAQDAEKEQFLTPTMRRQFHTLLTAAFDHGWLQLAFLQIDGQKAAAYLNFDYDNHIWVYNSGLNSAFREYSPGWVLLGYLLQHANQHGRSAFDFMRGSEDYKYRFGGIDRFVTRVQISRAA